jgi:polyketide cyclase/dehydrase/lipid transport protein
MGGAVACASHTVLDTSQCFSQWSPWFDLDPGMKYTCSGPVIGVGTMAWVGNSAIDSGKQEFIESMPDGRIVNALDFGGSQATAGYRLIADGSGSRLIQGMTAHGYNPVNRWFGAFLLDSVIGKDYVKGLAKLKPVLESRTHP